jgi:citrate lyase beta subunit
MPGDSRKKIEKGAAMDVDSSIMDLEDAIAITQKQQARESVAAALREVNFGRAEKLVRINQVISGWLYTDDIAATVDAHPDGYVIPKVESAEQVQQVSDWLALAEDRNGWQANSLKILAIIETARGVVNLKEIASSAERLDALIFGAEDLAGDMGARRTPQGWEVFYARSAVVLHAKAFGLQAIDTVYISLTDPDDSALAQEAHTALEMGYTGKLAIHPKQVAPIQRVFTPTAEEVERAQALVNAFNEQQAQGRGVFEYEGKMIDMPMIRAATATLQRAKHSKQA